MIVRFEASFAKDLRGVTDKPLLARVGQIIEEVKQAESRIGIRSMKNLKATTITIGYVSEITGWVLLSSVTNSYSSAACIEEMFIVTFPETKPNIQGL